MSRNRKLTIMVTMALMIALNIVLGRFLSFMTLTVKIDFGFVPIATMGMMFGPLVGGITGLLSDIIGMLIFSRGLPYFPLFTLNAFLYGVIYGIFLRKKNCKIKDILVCVIIECLVIYLGLTTVWLYIFNRFLMGNDALFYAILVERLFALCFIFPVHFVSLWLLKKQIEPRLAKALKSNANLNDYLKKQKFDVNLGLERVDKLLEYMGNPNKDLKFVHITGTNGKGSVCAFLQSCLSHSGYKTGMFVSPFLLQPQEVITIDGVVISDKEYENRVKEIEGLQRRLKKDINQTASQFEIMTALAFKYFKDNNCDIVIAEVGLGGLTDATNIIENPLLTIITKISLDHQNYLGNTLADIAKIKAGIIKKNRPLITVEQDSDVLEIIKNKAFECNAEMIFAQSLKSVGNNNVYEIVTVDKENIELSLGGVYQPSNAGIAYAGLNYLKEKEQFNKINSNTVKLGLTTAVNKGRFEKLSDKPYVIFDGAHNVAGIKSLSESIDKYFADKNIRLIMAFMADKDINGCLEILKDKDISFVDIAGNQRAMQAEEMCLLAQKAGVKSSEKSENILSAVEKYKLSADVIVICGSLYLYKDAHSAISKLSNSN